LVEQRSFLLLDAPGVESIAGHPQEELRIATVLPRVEPAGREAGSAPHRYARHPQIPPGWHLLVGGSGRQPPDSELLEEGVRAVERSHAISARHYQHRAVSGA